jgi:hypothetical protein
MDRTGRNGGERYGRTEERLARHRDELNQLWAWKDSREKEMSALRQRLAVLETKVAVYTTLGTVIALLIQAFLHAKGIL